MKLKTTCIYVSAGAVICFCIASLPVQTFAARASMTYGGGQAPPNPSGGAGSYTVRVAAQLQQASAEALKNELISEGFTSAQTQPAGDGTFDVVLGGLTSREQADALMGELRSSGYTPDSVIEGAAAGTSRATASPSGDSVFRVQVAEFASAAEAEQASEVLADDGFVNVDVVEENGKHILMLGTFNRKADAEALLTDVNRAGFALASVISRDRLRSSDAGAVSQADLSGLSDVEQEKTRDVLAMAQKVESGEASAAEIQQLRESIQQLSANQKAILGRQESNRSADREKLQRVFQHYREFDAAVQNGNFTAAEQALAQVRQIDPDEMWLDNRMQILERARAGESGAATSAVAAPGAGTVDPAQIQSLINEARALEASGKQTEATRKYRQVLALDPSNVEARSKIAGADGSTASSEADAGGIAGLMENKPLLYGVGGVIVLLLILFFWFKSRKRKQERDYSGAGGTTSFSTPPGIPGPGMASTSPGASMGSSLGAGTALAGAGTTGYDNLHTGDEEEPESEPTPRPAPVVTQPVPQSDTVSLEDMEEGSSAPATTPQPAGADAQDETVSLNFEDTTPPAAAAAAGSAAMDADLESLLKGSFSGAEENPAENSVASEPRTVYSQNFDSETADAPPSEWRGEYDYASLTVAGLGEAGHTQALKYEKPDGAGSATYHLSFPPAKGKIIAEYDIRCEQKNKFLLGVYLERDEDFKQSIHTIVHQLDPGAPASLRIQGEAAPYEMGSWSSVRFEVDLNQGTVNGFMDGNQVVKDAVLAVVPEYVNTLSIRDNLATTGTLYLDNIRISEA